MTGNQVSPSDGGDGTSRSNSAEAALSARLSDRSARVGVIGLGYVGLPLVRELVRSGFAVTGLDIDAVKIETLRAGRSYIAHVPDADVSAMVGSDGASGRLRPTSDFAEIAGLDVVVICVPTPLTRHREPDLSYVENTARTIGAHLRAGALVVLESTTYPGTTREVVEPILSTDVGGGRRACGRDYFLAFSPERENPGGGVPTRAIPKLVGGVDAASGRLAHQFYSAVVDRAILVSSPEVAEAAKLLENIYRAVNIALVNELKMLFDRMGLDVWEVVAAAASKPFGFQPFWPGPGWGGHCLAGGERVRVRRADRQLDTTPTLAELFERISAETPAVRVGDIEMVESVGWEALSLNTDTHAVSWQPISMITRRRFRGQMADVRLAGNRTLRVTDRHPMLVIEEGRVIVRSACELKADDRVPRYDGPTARNRAANTARQEPTLDLITALPPGLLDRLHVRINEQPWSRWERLLKSRWGWTIRDSIRSDSLQLRRFLEIESEVGVSRSQLTFRSGRGNSHTQFPAVLTISEAFCRFLGYYLSEGCITEDKNNPRVRLTFHRDETDLVSDVGGILTGFGVSHSIRNDPVWKTTTVRVGSIVLGHVLRDVLRTGCGSIAMRVPAVVMSAPTEHQRQLLLGLLRGDGDVYVHTGRRAYSRGPQRYEHHFNTGTVGYFSSSPELLCQADALLMEQGFHARRKAGKPHLVLSDPTSLTRMTELFSGAKADRLRTLAAACVRPGSNRIARPWAGGVSWPVREVRMEPAEEMVYSLEVPGTHTFATGEGVFVHNCIPVDPFYLTWLARRYEHPTRFVELAGEINWIMPDYVLGKLADALNDRGKPIRGSRVLVLGLAYKRDVDDLRESPSIILIEKLRAKGAVVDYHDPHIPRTHRQREHDLRMVSVPLTPDSVAGYDAVLIATDHSSVDYAMVVRAARLVVDARNATAAVTEGREKIVKA